MSFGHVLALVSIAWSAGTVVGAFVGWRLGGWSALRRMDNKLEHDQSFRQKALEHLARLEGARIVVSE